MFEFILIIFVVVSAISGMATYFWLTQNEKQAVTTQEPTASGSTKQAHAAQGNVLQQPRLAVMGAVHPKSGTFGFLKLFGLGHAPVFDFCFLPGPLAKGSLAPIVASTLETMHAEGDAVGTDVMELIHHGKTLAKNEALCFALLAKPRNSGHRIVAFVDKSRFVSPA